MKHLGILLSTFLVAVIATGIVRRHALARNILDIPNERSSHNLPTPRGGGLAIVVVATLAFAGLALFGVLKVDVLLALIGGIAVAIVGLLDDRHPLRAGIRLAIHVAAALWALWWLGGLPPLRVANEIVQFSWTGYVLGALGIVWTLNLFNFMDGIDGIAASEAVYVVLGGAWLTASGDAGGVMTVAVVVAATCGGFLLWNWAPAKIFLGDVGSGYLGYVIAVLALAAARHNSVAIWVWLILGGVFFVDATVTLLRRLLRGERVYQAHRSHAYQWLARRWGSHSKVTCAVLIVNVLWLLPCAVFATRRPSLAAATVIFAFAPLVLLAIATSGRREANDRRHGWH